MPADTAMLKVRSPAYLQRYHKFSKLYIARVSAPGRPGTGLNGYDS